MKYKIVADSCCDLTADMKTWQDFEIVPLTLEIGEYRIFDDENFDQDDFISRMKANGGNAKSACPAPDAFKKAYEGDYDAVFVLTITNQLSGTYNSALQGKMLYEEEFGDDKKIIVFDSLATSGIETIVAKKIKELADGDKNAEDIQKEIDAYIVNNTGLYFCLESLDALKSNGRLFALAAKVLEKIRVKLICKRTDQGNISLAAQDITLNRAMMKMSNLIAGELDGKLWFCTNNTKDVYKDMLANPEIEVSVSSPEYAWIRLHGKAVFENNMSVKEGCMNNPIVKGQYQTADNPIFEVFYLENPHGVIADFSGNPPYEF